MTLQDLGSIGEFIAAIVTIATLAYLAVQVSGEDSPTPHKSWPTKSWIAWLLRVSRAYPGCRIVLVGGQGEERFAEEILAAEIQRQFPFTRDVIVGQTRRSQADNDT